MSTTSSAWISECYALQIVPELFHVIAVGKIYGPTDTSGSPSYKQSSLLLLVDKDLILLSSKVWSFSGDYGDSLNSIVQEARDVALSSDGSYYVAGTVSGGFDFSGTQHCFILRLDQDLNLINARSFGVSGYTLTCNSLQVTRSADYMYVGGTIPYYDTSTSSYFSALFFAKLDANADTMIYTTLEHTNSNYGLRRILLENQMPYSGSNDNSRLYFCGYTSSGNDLLYGHVTSTGLTSIGVSLIFQFGSSASSEISFSTSSEHPYGKCDCRLTEDNAYMVAVFSTNYQKTISNSMSWYTYYYSKPYSNQGATTNSLLDAFTDPAWTGWSTCNAMDDPNLENAFIYYS